MKIGKSYAIVRSNKITAVYNIESENKLTRGKVQLSKCLENYLNFENKAGFELEYLKMLAKNKIISLLKQRKIKDVVQLILKYNIRLFK